MEDRSRMRTCLLAMSPAMNGDRVAYGILLRFVFWRERADEAQPEAAYANRTAGMDMEPLSPVRVEEQRQVQATGA